VLLKVVVDGVFAMASWPKPTLNGKLGPELGECDPRVRAALRLFVGTAGRLPVEEVARVVNLSESRLRHLIREEIGIPVRHYVKKVRLSRARKLVEGTFLSVKEITSVLGCSDISHFLRDYKTVFGETPSQTRRRISRLGQ
jgi:AraC family transcriptional regulator of arabinose operon